MAIMHCDYCGDPIEGPHAEWALATVGESIAPYLDEGPIRLHADHDHECLGVVTLRLWHLVGSNREGVQRSKRYVAQRTRQLDAWDAATIEQQERMVLEILSDGREVEAREIEDAIAERFKCLPWGNAANSARGALRRLHRRGEVDRKRNPHTGQRRYLWFRATRELSGPIADLDRMIGES